MGLHDNKLLDFLLSNMYSITAVKPPIRIGVAPYHAPYPLTNGKLTNPPKRSNISPPLRFETGPRRPAIRKTIVRRIRRGQFGQTSVFSLSRSASTRFAIGTRTCAMLSRSRIVTASSVSVSKSTVTHSGVPISSWRR